MVGIWSQIMIWLSFSDRSSVVAMATNFMVKMGEIGRLTFIRRLGIAKRSEISKFRFQWVYLRRSGYIVQNLVNFGPVTPEFKKGKDVHPLVDQQFGYAAPLLDVAGISTEFSGAITTQFSFSYSLGA